MEKVKSLNKFSIRTKIAAKSGAGTEDKSTQIIQ
jgi:hypothetical protein